MKVSDRLSYLWNDLWTISPFVAILFLLIFIGVVLSIIASVLGAFIKMMNEPIGTSQEPIDDKEEWDEERWIEEKERERREEQENREWQERRNLENDLILMRLEKASLEEFRKNARCCWCRNAMRHVIPNFDNDENNEDIIECQLYNKAYFEREAEFPRYCRDYDGPPGKPQMHFPEEWLDALP